MIIVITASVAFIVSTLVFPKLLLFAKKHHIVDSPNARKLHRTPIPVLGGVAVYLGILMGYLVLASFSEDPIISWSLVAITFMQIIGVWDDINDLPAKIRFIVEILLMGAIIAISGIYVDDFHGFLGIGYLNTFVAIILSVFAGVGIINAINMIDGIDGYVSGYCVSACLCFAILFLVTEETVMACMATVVAASLLPFFFHNVFGMKSKMFIGDGGTMMLGVLLALFFLFTLSSKSKCSILETKNVGLLALALAVMCIPVFDTLRVMIFRIFQRRSPFRPDKTHLHHLFIEMGFSHLGATISIISINISIVLIWLVVWKVGLSIEWQTYIVILLGIMVTFGFYKLMKVQQFGGGLDENGHPQGTDLWRFFLKLGTKSHIEKGKFWRTICWLMER